jgi:hypothetical protein
MKRAVLTRMETGDQGTFGRLQVGPLVLFTGELPWRDNHPNLSCVPAGIYICEWTYSPRFRRNLYSVTAVPDRTGVRKHAANLMGDVTKGFRTQLSGCIALGEKLGWLDGQKAVLLSAPAMRKFEDFMERSRFELEIKDV